MTKQELKRFIPLRKEVTDLEARIKTLRSQAEKTTSTITGLPGGAGAKDRIAEIACELADLSDDYMNKVLDHKYELERMEQAIESLKSPCHRKMMRLRYIDGLKWERICVDMGYEWAQIHREHGKALKYLKDDTL